ncbi:hypothetical protein NDU88_008526 [Pleurodeles waltl]|uniref:Uncharacterized protein n=1 Tax=Pleurodeles waltl TaxID=8319 RepID=A0AAV7RW04_PLEWA|nr:hypothetical protein NDU88_008526 [Pleurodeles waltl]
MGERVSTLKDHDQTPVEEIERLQQEIIRLHDQHIALQTRIRFGKLLEGQLHPNHGGANLYQLRSLREDCQLLNIEEPSPAESQASWHDQGSHPHPRWKGARALPPGFRPDSATISLEQRAVLETLSGDSTGPDTM